MKTGSNKTFVLAVIAAALVLFACADSGQGRSDGPAEGAAVSGTAPERSGQGGQTSQPRPQGPAAGEAIAAPSSGAAQAPANAPLTENERNTIEVVRKTKNSVVFITNMQYVRDFFYSSDQPVPRGSGSGFVWDDRGHIVTNFHVIEDGDKFMVSLPNQKQVEAKLVGRDPNKDIAVLRLGEQVTDLTPVVVGTSRDLQVGQKVIAIGNPFGFDHTVTQGIVSALGRSMPGAAGVTIRDMIQTDASINPGNSGGPLLNSAGELIGMNTMIASPSGASSGVGFALPVDTVRKIVPQIIQFGKVTRPDLGVTFVRDEIARRAGVEGAVILEVNRATRAYDAGLRGLYRDNYGRLLIRDVITAIDSVKIKSYDDLFTALDNYKIGDTVALTVEREGKARRVDVQLVGTD